MTRRSIEISSFQHTNPIPCATRIGPLIESSIIPPFNDGSRDVPDTLAEQIDNLFLHMGNMLAEAGATWDDMAKVTFFVADAAASREALNGPWVERFPDASSRPSRHNLQVPGGDKSQISCVFTAWVA
ncbi:MAG: RidA family protein [Actinomycetia bacterium]|nr:RidA family protein [Actinomycetes bacterium]